MNVILNLSVDEVNYILNVLGLRPYGEVVQLIAKVKSQGDVQVIPPTPADPKISETPAASEPSDASFVPDVPSA